MNGMREKIILSTFAFLLILVSLHVVMHSRTVSDEETSVQSRIQSTIQKAGLAPTIHERAKITSDMSKIASLLATEELYNIVAKDERSNPRRKGFVSWVHALTASQARREVERKVRQAMEDTNSPYDQQIRSEIPRKFQSLLPALASQVAHESTEAAFEKLKTQMVQAGQWDKGYLESGNNLVGNPIHFEQLKGNKAGLKAACRNECVGHAACRGYTYHPTQAVCYLKTVASPVRGVDCESDCWYWGRVVGHPHEMSLSLADAEKDLGLHVTDLKVGSGEVLAPGDTATIGYVGTLENGVVFDQGKYVFTFGRGQVIKGDDLGLQGMRVGGRRRLVIPPELGYGRAGYSGLIPGDATLRFDVTLLALSHSPIASGFKSSDSPE